MPRGSPPSSVTLLLPRLSPSASGATSLAVLLKAHELAAEAGHALDIQSLMDDDQREQYRTLHLHLPPRPTDSPPQPHQTPLPPVPPTPQHLVETPTPAPATPTPAPLTPAPDAVFSPATPAGHPPLPGTPGTPISGTAPGATPRRVVKIPDLSHLHWKQRAKRLAEYAREQEMLANGETVPEIVLVSSSTGGSTEDRARVKEDKVKDLPEREKHDIRSSASYWNSLLVQARKVRGPQWDFNTQQHLFDRRSEEYFTHGRDPPASPPSPKKRKLSAGGDGRVNGSVVAAEGEDATRESVERERPGSASGHGISAPFLPPSIHRPSESPSPATAGHRPSSSGPHQNGPSAYSHSPSPGHPTRPQARHASSSSSSSVPHFPQPTTATASGTPAPPTPNPAPGSGSAPLSSITIDTPIPSASGGFNPALLAANPAMLATIGNRLTPAQLQAVHQAVLAQRAAGGAGPGTPGPGSGGAGGFGGTNGLPGGFESPAHGNGSQHPHPAQGAQGGAQMFQQMQGMPGMSGIPGMSGMAGMGGMGGLQGGIHSQSQGLSSVLGMGGAGGLGQGQGQGPMLNGGWQQDLGS